VYLLEGWYIVSYGLGIYFLNLSIGFLSPVADPAVDGVRLAHLKYTPCNARRFGRECP
jgi:type IV secretory pathway TrbD component